MEKNKNMKIVILIAVVVILGLVVFFKVNRDRQLGSEHSKTASEAITSGEYSIWAKEGELESLLEKKQPIIFVYGQNNCGACHRYLPYVEKLNREFDKKAFVKYYNLSENTGDGIPIGVTPSLAFWGKDGLPYKPTKEIMDKYGLEIVKNRNGNHVFTVHQGPIPPDDLKELIDTMIGA